MFDLHILYIDVVLIDSDNIPVRKFEIYNRL